MSLSLSLSLHLNLNLNLNLVLNLNYRLATPNSVNGYKRVKDSRCGHLLAWSTKLGPFWIRQTGA